MPLKVVRGHKQAPGKRRGAISHIMPKAPVCTQRVPGPIPFMILPGHPSPPYPAYLLRLEAKVLACTAAGGAQHTERVRLIHHEPVPVHTSTRAR